MDDVMDGAMFSYRPAGSSPASSVVDEFNLWAPRTAVATAPQLDEDAFDVLAASGAADGADGGAQVAAYNYFSVDLPPDASLAGLAVQTQAARLKRNEHGLQVGQHRLELFAQWGGLSPDLMAKSAAEAAFSLPGGAAPSLARPELELQKWLDAANPLPADGSAESFALPKFPDDWKETAQAAGEFFGKIQRLFTTGDLIESCQGGRRVGITIISLTGDFTTIWGDSADRAAPALHQQVLAQAIATRAAWMSLAASVAGGAIKLAVLFPTSPWLAIPAAYKFFRQVLEQVQNWPKTA